MKKNIVRLNESQLKKIIAESVKKVLKEDSLDSRQGTSDFIDYENNIKSLIDQCDDCLLLGRIIEKSAKKLSTLCASRTNVDDWYDNWFSKTKEWAEKVAKDASYLENL